jgi:hypothetical protein
MGNLIDKLSDGAHKRTDGVFYASVGQLWQGNEEEFNEFDLAALRRQSLHVFYHKSAEATKQTNDADLIPAEDPDRSEFSPGSSMDSWESESAVEKKRKRLLERIAIDGRERNSADNIAHLLPHATSCARLYAPLVEAVVGLDLSQEPPARKKLKRQILVHGLYTLNDKTNKYERARATGVKHCRTNMARVIAQRKYLDFNPSLIMIPIMTLQQVLDYDGGRYSVLVIAATPSVYEETVLTKRYDLCTNDDIKLATSTLASFVKGVAFSLANETDDADIVRLKVPRERRAIQLTKETLEDAGKVRIPEILGGSKKLRVAKLHFDLAAEDTHQECDPFLLYVKATVVWSSLQGQKLLPGCPLPHNCEECLEQDLFSCQCDVAYDPGTPEYPVPAVVQIMHSSSK